MGAFEAAVVNMERETVWLLRDTASTPMKRKNSPRSADELCRSFMGDAGYEGAGQQCRDTSS